MMGVFTLPGATYGLGPPGLGICLGYSVGPEQPQGKSSASIVSELSEFSVTEINRTATSGVHAGLPNVGEYWLGTCDPESNSNCAPQTSTSPVVQLLLNPMYILARPAAL